MRERTYIEQGEDALATHNLKEILRVGLQMVRGDSWMEARWLRRGHHSRHEKYQGQCLIHDPVLMYQLFGGDLYAEGGWV